MFDLHVHAGPDVVPRLANDLAVGAMYAAAGFSGFVLKAHYESTVGRAAAITDSTGLRVFGGLALNQHVGGLNPEAVHAALSAGARMIWLPTADSHTQAAAVLPRLSDLNDTLSRRTYALPPLDPSSEQNARAIFAAIGEADAVLATGHVSAGEIDWVLREAPALGVTRILLTHPGYTVPSVPADRVRDWCATTGAVAEITAYQLLHQPRTSAEDLARYVRTVGLEHCVLSSDAGQPDSPPPPAALEQLIDELAGHGLDRGALTVAASQRPADLVDPQASAP